MEDFLQQIEKALDCKLYYIALQSVLTLPDICSNLVNTNPKALVIDRYSNWYDTYARKPDDKLTGKICYKYRCSNLHEGKLTYPKSDFNRVFFVIPNQQFHFYNCTMKIGDSIGYIVNLEVFCNNLIAAVRNWLPLVADNPAFKKNYPNLVKTYPNLGISNIPIPFIS